MLVFLLAETITSDSSISLGFAVAVLVPALGSAAVAIGAAATTRSELRTLRSQTDEDRKADRDRIAALEAWRLRAGEKIAIVHDRQARSGSYNKINVSEE